MYWSKNHCRLLAVFAFTFWNIDFVCKSSRRLVFCEIPALIFFPEFIGKQLSGRLLSSKVRGRKLQFDLKKRLHRKHFPVTFVNILGFSEWFFHKIISGGCLYISFCISLFLWFQHQNVHCVKYARIRVFSHPFFRFCLFTGKYRSEKPFFWHILRSDYFVLISTKTFFTHTRLMLSLYRNQFQFSWMVSIWV